MYDLTLTCWVDCVMYVYVLVELIQVMIHTSYTFIYRINHTRILIWMHASLILIDDTKAYIDALVVMCIHTKAARYIMLY